MLASDLLSKFRNLREESSISLGCLFSQNQHHKSVGHNRRTRMRVVRGSGGCRSKLRAYSKHLMRFGIECHSSSALLRGRSFDNAELVWRVFVNNRQLSIVARSKCQ